MALIYLKAFIALFVVVDPVGNIPMFLTVTSSLEGAQRHKAFSVSVFVAFVILVSFALLGQFILNELFQINIADVRIAGGILLVIISVQHLLTSNSSIASKNHGQQSPEEIGCVPLACPLLAGPGAMVTSLSIWHGSKEGPYAALTAIILVLGLFWFLMRFVENISQVTGKLIITAISKVMLVFVAAIGVNMIMQGILAYFP